MFFATVISLDLKHKNTEQIETLWADEALATEEKAPVQKIDLYLLPTIWLMHLLSYVDRTHIGMPKLRISSVDGIGDIIRRPCAHILV